ncbi:MAG TPA: dihydrodipicolinate synthase family protein [Vicinamibacterales bacterium]|nr:dihydrodipicolinate synthase family protein [Vicinamibacterales bacterium]
MEIPRRTFLGAVGAAAVAASIPELGAVSGAGANNAAPMAQGNMSKVKFWVAACTPCDKNLKFEESAYKDMMAWFKEQGADGIVVLGTTGEYPSFSIAERKKATEVALKHANGLDMIIQSGTTNFPETIELSKHAADNGANGLLVIPPFYYKRPQTEGLTKYYSLLFDAVKLPINLYHIPGTSGVPISLDLLHSLEHYPNLAGIKDSDPPAEDYENFAKEFPKLNMRTGISANLERAFNHDMGAILMEGNLFTKQIAAVFAAKRAGKDYTEAMATFREAMKIMRPAGVGSYGPMKYALSLQMGTPQTYQRPPFLDVTDDQKAKIKAGLDQIKQMSTTTHM